MKRFVLTAVACLSLLGAAQAQDLTERTYYYQVLNPQRSQRLLFPKPKVEGYAFNAPARVQENLDRGVTALINEKNQVYVGWRLLDTDPETVGFNVYRTVGGGRAVKLNGKVITKTTDFVDTKPAIGKRCTYFVKPVVKGREGAASEAFVLTEDAAEHPNYISIKFQGEYSANRIAVGDLNGDGKYDFVIKQPAASIDPGSPRRSPSTYKLEAYLQDGTYLWTYDLGWNIEQGIWYSPFIVYDLDGDGKAEVIAKTGPAEDYRDEDGIVRTGPEYFSVLDGMTGKVLAVGDWIERSQRFGDYNRNSRHQIGIAYLDGKTPALLILKGTYKAMVVDAYEFHNGQLTKLWRWDGDEENPVVRSMGAHNTQIADVDDDGRDEIIIGSAVLDDNGTCLWSSGLGHADKVFVTDVDPTRPGLEIFFAIEPYRDGDGVCLADARTGEIIWQIDAHTGHVGDGMVADIDPAYPGLECFASEDSKGGMTDKYLFTSTGERLGSTPDVPGCRVWAFWDADLVRETVGIAQADPAAAEAARNAAEAAGGAAAGGRNFGGNAVVKYRGPVLTNGIQGSISLIADIMGDWREEFVTVMNGELRVYQTTIPATDRRVTFMRDGAYRAQVAHRSMGYDQAPMPSYYVGMPVETASQFRPLVEKAPKSAE